MQETPDSQLLRDYAENGDEAAFREIASRYTDLVYSAALRQLESSDLAADITQSVFVDLARKARLLSAERSHPASVVGWLHRATRYAALNHLRDSQRRVAIERQAMEQLLADNESSVDWEKIRPALDEALDELEAEDREALLLRYFKNQDLRTVGRTFGVSDDAAQKRVSRAIERLREFFNKRGISVGASGLAVVLSANAVQAAPAGLAVTISAAALASTAASVATIVAATTKAIAMTALQKTIVTASIATLAGVGIYEAHQAAHLHEQVLVLRQSQLEQLQGLQRERDESARKLAALREDNERLNRNSGELLKLRGEVGVLRRQAEEVDQLRKANLELQQLVLTNSQAATKPTAPPPIAKVVLTFIKQPRMATEDQLRTNITAQAGSLYEPESIDADVRRLYDTGWFSNIRVQKAESDGGVTLNYVLQEKPKLTQIHFSGNSKFSEESLAGLVHSRAGELLDERALFADTQRIQEVYVKLGFPNTKVRYTSHINEDRGEGDVLFEIVE